MRQHQWRKQNNTNSMIPKKILNKDFYACSTKPEQIESVIDGNAFDVDWRCFWQQPRRLTRGPLLPGMPAFPGAPGSPWREQAFSQRCLLTHTFRSTQLPHSKNNKKQNKTFGRLDARRLQSKVKKKKKKVTHFHSEVIPSQSAESSALSIRKLRACMPGNCRNARNNRSFPAPLNAPVWFYQPCAHSFSFNQKRGKSRK